MERYIGTKMIKASSMNLGDYNKYKGWTIPENENPLREGYIVEYADDYVSWSPKEAFEESYRRIDGLTFGIAIELMKQGYRVAREGWNGKGMWLVLIKAGNAMYKGFDMQDCIGMKTANDVMQPGWLASQTDMLADDWNLVE